MDNLHFQFLEYVNSSSTGRGGYMFSGSFIVLGSIFIFFMKTHKNNLLRKRKRNCRDRSEWRSKHRRVIADKVSIAPDGTLIGINGVPIGVSTSPSESNSNYDNSDVRLADPDLSRSGGGSMSRGSHHEQEEILLPPKL